MSIQEAELSDQTIPERSDSTRKRSRKSFWQKWMRLAHVYTSMICLLIVLFFSVTGLTLNHPTWMLGTEATSSTTTGIFPETVAVAPEVDWLAVAEYLRSEHDLRGSVGDHEIIDSEGSISFKGPGFAADAFFDVTDRSYEISVESQGPVGFFNDLHKGRDTASSFKWLIDASAIVLVVISLTGIGLQLFLRARRRSAVLTAVAGSIIFVGFVLLALR